MHDWKASRKRFEMTISGSKRIDKVPYFPIVGEQMISRIVGTNVRNLYSSPENYSKYTLMANEFFNTDAIYLPTCYPGPVEALAFAEANGKKDLIKWFDHTLFVEQGAVCKSEEDIEKLKIPDHNQNKIWSTTFKAAKQIFKETQFPQIPGFGIWSVVQQLRGIHAYRDMRNNPEILMMLCEKVYQSQLDVYQNWIDNVSFAPFIFCTAYSFNKQMMSFDDAMKYEGQFLKRFYDEVKVPFILHNCSMEPYVEEVCKEFNFVSSINGSHPLDINFWIEFKKKFPKITISGANIDVSRELLTGTPEIVEEKVKENILNLAPNGRYIVSPICTLPYNIPLPNIMAVSNAIEKYGYYPIEGS